jgi:hypothetical protein
MNAYLKVAGVCEINKTHLPLPTYICDNGNTNKWCSYRNVSKMLGHKNLRTTQHYAKNWTKKLGEHENTARQFQYNSGKKIKKK